MNVDASLEKSAHPATIDASPTLIAAAASARRRRRRAGIGEGAGDVDIAIHGTACGRRAGVHPSARGSRMLGGSCHRSNARPGNPGTALPTPNASDNRAVVLREVPEKRGGLPNPWITVRILSSGRPTCPAMLIALVSRREMVLHVSGAVSHRRAQKARCAWRSAWEQLVDQQVPEPRLVLLRSPSALHDQGAVDLGYGARQAHVQG